jgi:hypothetical protein
LHSVIAADREVYAQLVMQRLHDAGVVEAKENWEEAKALPLPTHLTRLASERIQRKGAEFHYVVRSLWPINPRNGPQTDVEKAGLTHVAADPEKPFYQEESLGGRTYFTAVYADTARTPLCAECHNAHPKSPKKDYKEGSVLGGIIVRVPLEF